MALLGDSGHSYDLFYDDVLLALERFALIEARKTRNVNPGVSVSYPKQVRSTPLLQKFLVFKDLD
jgi:hypothetical protein